MNTQNPPEEYQSLRHEVINRATLLHILIALSGILTFFALIAALAFDFDTLLLLLLPPIFAGLLFNYQANQMTLEQVARYIQNKYGGNEDWDTFYGQAKTHHRLTSFLKIIPLFLPLLIPMILELNQQVPPRLQWLAWTDMVLFALSIYNFKYKL